MTAGFDRPSTRGSGKRSLLGAAYSAARLLAWLAEEWYRAVVAWTYRRRGYLVVYDRHFYYDYYASDVRRRNGKSLPSRIHGYLLRRFYPKPDLVIVLDAPAQVLQPRKNEQTRDSLEQLRQEYLAFLPDPKVRIVDATKPIDEVVNEIAGLVRASA